MADIKSQTITFEIRDPNCLCQDIMDERLVLTDPSNDTYSFTGTIQDLKEILSEGEFESEDIDSSINEWEQSDSPYFIIHGRSSDSIMVIPFI